MTLPRSSFLLGSELRQCQRWSTAASAKPSWSWFQEKEDGVWVLIQMANSCPQEEEQLLWIWLKFPITCQYNHLAKSDSFLVNLTLENSLACWKCRPVRMTDNPLARCGNLWVGVNVDLIALMHNSKRTTLESPLSNFHRALLLVTPVKPLFKTENAMDFVRSKRNFTGHFFPSLRK